MAVALMTAGLRVPADIDIKSKIEVAAVRNQIPVEKMLALCDCESQFNPKAWNKDDPHGGAMGLFQWLPTSWRAYEKLYGKKMDVWDPADNIAMTAFALGAGHWDMWWNCSKKIGMIR